MTLLLLPAADTTFRLRHAHQSAGAPTRARPIALIHRQVIPPRTTPATAPRLHPHPEDLEQDPERWDGLG